MTRTTTATLGCRDWEAPGAGGRSALRSDTLDSAAGGELTQPRGRRPDTVSSKSFDPSRRDMTCIFNIHRKVVHRLLIDAMPDRSCLWTLEL